MSLFTTWLVLIFNYFLLLVEPEPLPSKDDGKRDDLKEEEATDSAADSSTGNWFHYNTFYVACGFPPNRHVQKH